MILPGDRVDVIAIPPATSQGPPQKAVTILRGIRILAVGTNLEDPTATPSPEEMASATVTLEVNPKQADLLAWADANSNLRLALRSPREPVRSEPVADLTLLGNGAAPGLVPAIGPPAPVIGPPAGLPAPAPARTPSSSVEIIVGDAIATPGPL
jgi:Flp pilus assembly protein CpaB